MGDWSTGVLVIERDHKDGPRQTEFTVLNVRAVPLDAGHLEFTTKIGGHTHETTVRAVFRHAGELLHGLREVDHTAVGVSVLSAHPVVANIEEFQNLLHRVDTGKTVSDTGFNHVFLAQI